jgi:uncharacterized protein YecE (DUF72 family)
LFGERKLTTRELRVGCCGFPQPLVRYAQSFSVVEVQQTFYQPPLLRTLARWRASVPQEFKFTLKAWQLITHEATSPTGRVSCGDGGLRLRGCAILRSG